MMGNTWTAGAWKRVAVAWLAAVLFLTAGVTSAWASGPAQDPSALGNLSLEDLMHVTVEPVFGAAGRLQPATEAPSSVSIVTAADIAKYGYRSLAEILRNVRGLYVTNDRNYSYAGARGFARPGDYNTRLLLLVDGHRLNDDVFDQAGIGPELGLDPETFARVEIIRGPASALYGTSAFFAVVSITTKQGRDLQGLSASGGVASLGTTRAYLSGGLTRPTGLDAAFSANLTQSDGAARLYYPAYDDNDINHGVAMGLDGETVRGLTGRLAIGHLTLSSAYGWRKKVVPTAAFDTLFNDPRFTTVDERGFIDADYRRPWHGAAVDVRAYADRYRYDGEYPYAPMDGDGPGILFTDYGHGVWWGTEGRVTRPLPKRQTLVAGVEFRDFVQQDQGAAYEDNRIPAFATGVASHALAGYLQDEWRLLRDRLLLSAGARYDAHAGINRASPRASVVWTPVSTRSFKYLYGTAFRAPNAYELDYLTNGVRNTALREETLGTHEVIWEEYVHQHVRTSVSAYWNNADGLITLVGDDPSALMYVNDGRVRARGVETEVEVRLAGGVEALGSYAYGRAVDSATDMDLTNAPRHLGKLRLSAAGPVEGSTVALDVQAMSDRITIARAAAPAHVVANVTYRQHLTTAVGLTLAVRNLFDSDYADPASEEHRQDLIPQDGRTIRLGLEWSWTPR